MARQESDREDLLHEATALVERAEFVPLEAESQQRVVVGFRRGGAASIFFDDDPVYQFNTAGQLRRAFCDGRLLKAEAGRLISLQRIRQQGEVQLVRYRLDEVEQDSLVGDMAERLNLFHQQLSTGQWRVVGQVPVDADLVGRVLSWLEWGDPRIIAEAPNIGC